MKMDTSGRFAVALVLLAGLATPALTTERTPAAPQIVPRTAWGAKPADASLRRRHTPREIVIHHSAEKRRPQMTLREKLRRLQQFSQSAGLVGTTPKQPWGDLPYHFYVDATGRIGEGRNLAFAGDSNTPYDTVNRIQVVAEGNFDAEVPAPAQLAALDRLVLWLAARHGVPPAKISGHADHVGNTQCPGQGLKSHLPTLRAKVARARRGHRVN